MTIELWFDETMNGYAAIGAKESHVGYEKGRNAGTTFGISVRIIVDDLDRFIDEKDHEAKLAGHLTGDLFSGDPQVVDGKWNLFMEGLGRIKKMVYRFEFLHGGETYYFHGEKVLDNDPLAADALSDLTTLFTKVSDATGKVVAAGIIRFNVFEIFDLLRSLEVSGTDRPMEAKRLFLSFFLTEETRILIEGWKDFSLKRPRRRLSRDAAPGPVYDVVVVGSGYGGSVMAARLSDWSKDGKKKSVCLLERGKEWIGGEFPDEPWEILKEIKSSIHPMGLFDYQSHEGIDVLVGNGLGGTSLINANVMIRPEPEVFVTAGWPAKLPNMAPYLEKAGETLHIGRDPALPPKAVVFSEAAKKTAGVTAVETLEIAVTFVDTPREQEGIFQNACVNCGGCVTGCNFTAKNTVDMNYLCLAEKQGTAIFTCTEVDTIKREADGTYLVHWSNPANRQKGTINASKVILSAGPLGSFGILQRSRERHGLKVSARLGESFSGNGDILGFGYNTNFTTDINVGPTITTVAKYRQSEKLDRHFIIEEGGIPKALMFIVRRLIPALRSLGTTTGLGIVDSMERAARAAADLAFIETRGALNNSLVYLGIGQEETLGSLSLQDGTARVVWPGVADENFAKITDGKMEEITSQIGGVYFKNPRSRVILGDHLITVHPLGGCRMGDDETKGVVNYKGEVFSHEGGLYVVDGSMIPTPLGVNPALTIAALAEWCAENITNDWSQR